MTASALFIVDSMIFSETGALNFTLNIELDPCESSFTWLNIPVLAPLTYYTGYPMVDT